MKDLKHLTIPTQDRSKRILFDYSLIPVIVRNQNELDDIPPDYPGEIIIIGKIGDYITTDRIVTSRGYSHVITKDRASVCAYENSLIIANDNSTVMAFDDCTVICKDKSRVEVWDTTATVIDYRIPTRK